MLPSPHPTFAQTYAERSDQPDLAPLAIYLLRLCQYKRTNLCVSADVTTTRELLHVAEEVGEHICVLKTHADIIIDFGDRTIRALGEIARRKHFLIFEDRKFGDIGNTVQLQYSGGPLTIVKWAHIVNANLFPGPAIIPALAQTAQKAIIQHNTSVQTDIRASPTASVAGSANVTVNGDEEEDEGEGEQSLDSASERDEAQYNYLEEEVDYRRRKQSVVSVCTTISMKSEALSPLPTMRPSLPRDFRNGSGGSFFGSYGDGEDADPTNNNNGNTTANGGAITSDVHNDADAAATAAAALAQLGPPQYYRGLLLLAQMSSAGNFFTPEYTAACVAAAREQRAFVVGFIAQRSLNELPGDNFVTMTPGVQLAAGGDALGQQYNTPAHAIAQQGSDIIIVGRGILAAPDRARAAAEYRRIGWAAYEERLRAARKSRADARH